MASADGGGRADADDMATSESSNLSGVRSKWQTIADSKMAQQLQQAEFMDHFDKNRFERRLVGLDTKISKATQKLEDTYAAEYREQVRRDREKADAEIARQIQEQLDLERQERERERRAAENKDKELALKLELAERKKIEERQKQQHRRPQSCESYSPRNPGGPNVTFEEPRYVPSPTSPVVPVAPPKPSRSYQHNAVGVPSPPLKAPPHQCPVPDLIPVMRKGESHPPPRPPPPVLTASGHPGGNHKHHLVNDLRGAKTKQLPLLAPGEPAGAYDPPWSSSEGHSPGSDRGSIEERPKLRDYIVQRAEKHGERPNRPKEHVPVPPPIKQQQHREAPSTSGVRRSVEVPLNLRDVDPVKPAPVVAERNSNPSPPGVLRPEPGMTPEQAAAIRAALLEEDSRLAAELQDGELSRAMQKKERKARMIHTGEGHLQIGGLRIRGLGKSEVASNEVNLIRFDDLSERPPEVNTQVPERQPPKEAPIPEPSALPIEPSLTAISPSNAEAHPEQLTHHHWQSTDSQSSSSESQPLPIPEHPGEEPYLNTHARRRRDIIAIGGVQVLPDVLLPK